MLPSSSATHFTARVNEHDLAHEGGAPGPLRTVLGLSVEEYDALADNETNGVTSASQGGLNTGGGRAGTFNGALPVPLDSVIGLVVEK